MTQQEFGVDAIREIVNVLLLRGNIGREGAGPCPIRGHSNVQGNRTCGIDHRPAEAWLARLDAACGITSPRAHGLDTVQTIKAMQRGDVKVFLGMGGNFALATPDTALCIRGASPLRADGPRQHQAEPQPPGPRPGGPDPAVPGADGKRHQRSGLQQVTVEDSMSMVHLSVGMNHPASPQLLSEPAIIAGIAQATLPDSRTPWEEYVADYDLIRDKMAEAIAGFEGCNRRVRQPLGFRLRQPARELVFLTDTGRGELLRRAVARRGPAAGQAGVDDDAVARPVQYDDLLRQRPLPGSQEPADAAVA